MTSARLAETFARHLGQALEMMSGEAPAVAAEPVSGDGPQPGSSIWHQPFGIPGTGAWLAGEEQTWIDLGALLLRCAGIDAGDAPTSKTTFLETVNQAFSGLATELGRIIQTEITVPAGETVQQAPAGPTWNRVSIRFPDGTAGDLLIAFSAETEALAFRPEAAIVVHEPKQETPPARSIPPGVENSRTLELLLDVELPVSVSFGRAQLPLKDVIKLTTGSIVELNRTVGEPVEVIVNNCVIARGEVVVVEGNFGVRIEQVISRQDRLRTLY